MLINHAIASSVVKEHAVTVGKFNQTLADADFAYVLVLEFFDIVEPKSGCQICDLLFVYPNVAWGPGAAVATAGALKTQSL